MRLIDADELLNNMKSELERAIIEIEEKKINETDALIVVASAIALKKFVKKQPTVYDIDKVVEELEERSIVRANSKSFYDNPQKGEYVDEVVLLSKAIEIVKEGGKDE